VRHQLFGDPPGQGRFESALHVNCRQLIALDDGCALRRPLSRRRRIRLLHTQLVTKRIPVDAKARGCPDLNPVTLFKHLRDQLLLNWIHDPPKQIRGIVAGQRDLLLHELPNQYRRVEWRRCGREACHEARELLFGND
jgi:hypothetical protein